jgi:hypothetical protein
LIVHIAPGRDANIGVSGGATKESEERKQKAESRRRKAESRRQNAVPSSLKIEEECKFQIFIFHFSIFNSAFCFLPPAFCLLPSAFRLLLSDCLTGGLVSSRIGSS